MLEGCRSFILTSSQSFAALLYNMAALSAPVIVCPVVPLPLCDRNPTAALITRGRSPLVIREGQVPDVVSSGPLDAGTEGVIYVLISVSAEIAEIRLLGGAEMGLIAVIRPFLMPPLQAPNYHY